MPKHLALAFALFLALLAAAGPAAAADGELLVIKTPINDSITPDVLKIAETLGYTTREGIRLEFIGALPASQHVAAVVGGQIHVTPGSHINRTIAGIAAGARVTAVVGKTETSEELPHMVAVVPKDSPIKRPEDLEGKVIGIPSIGGCNEYTPYAFLVKAGVADPKNKVEITVIPEKNLEQALRQGDIDLAMLHSTPEEIVRKGEFAILFSDWDVWGPDGGATPFIFSNQFIADHPEAVRSFVSAVADTLNWINANPRQSLEITAKAFNLDINRMAARYFTPDGIMKERTVDVWNELLVDFKEIEAPVPPERVFTNAFNKYYTGN
jgi:ABC-type nitrate/sulfonate/bicarbonate transport system substrate-binding protein